LVLVLSVFLGLLTTSALNASPEDEARFKAFFTQGEKMYGAAEYGAAIWNFRQADLVKQTPEVAFDLAKAAEKIGDQAVATYWYRQYLKRAPSASDSISVAERIGQALSSAERDGKSLVEVSSPGAEQLALSNGRFLEDPMAMFVKPGDYSLSAKFPDGEKTMSVRVNPGTVTSVNFEPMAPPLLDSGGAEVQTRLSKPFNKLKWVSFLTAGVGVLGIGVGLPVGFVSQGHAAQCCSATADPSLNLTQRQQLAGQANTEAFTANALIFVGIGLVAIGATLFVLSLLGVGA
jgi:hypothetical protein